MTDVGARSSQEKRLHPSGLFIVSRKDANVSNQDL